MGKTPKEPDGLEPRGWQHFFVKGEVKAYTELAVLNTKKTKIHPKTDSSQSGKN